MKRNPFAGLAPLSPATVLTGSEQNRGWGGPAVKTAFGCKSLRALSQQLLGADVDEQRIGISIPARADGLRIRLRVADGSVARAAPMKKTTDAKTGPIRLDAIVGALPCLDGLRGHWSTTVSGPSR